MTTDFQAFGKNVRAAREAMGKTQTWLAGAVTTSQRKVDPTIISEIERGIPSLSANRRSTNAAIGKLLNVTVPAALAPVAGTTPASVNLTTSANGFSFERAASTVQTLAELGLPTGEVKAAIMQRISSMLGS